MMDRHETVGREKEYQRVEIDLKFLRTVTVYLAWWWGDDGIRGDKNCSADRLKNNSERDRIL
jgi:hypothetical protein